VYVCVHVRVRARELNKSGVPCLAGFLWDERKKRIRIFKEKSRKRDQKKSRGSVPSQQSTSDELASD